MKREPDFSKSFRVTKACEDYIRGVLAGGRSLSAAISRSVHLGGGRIRLIPDPGFEKLSESRFHQGGVWEIPVNCDVVQPVPNCGTPVMLAMIRDYLAAPRHFAVFEHGLASRLDPWIQRERRPIAFCEDEVYFVLEPCSAPELIEQTVKRASTATGLVGICMDLRNSNLEPGVVIAAGDVSRLAHHVDAMIVSAFDREGWLWWTGRNGA